jgi:hypothetical protein
MKKTLVGFAALLALSGTAFAGDFAETLHYPESPRVESARSLDNSSTASVRVAQPGTQQDALATTSLRYDDGAAPGVKAPRNSW